MASSCTSLPLGLLVLTLLSMATADVRVWGIRGYGLSGDATSAPDPYVKVFCGHADGGQTGHVTNNPNPSWGSRFSFPDGRVGDSLRLEVWDKDTNFDDHLGTCRTTVKYGTYKISCGIGKGTLEFYYEL